MTTQFLGEFLGTAMLILLGDGIVAGVCLKKTKSEAAGWVAITLGWGLAVTIAVYSSGFLSDAHLNPAVTVAMVMSGKLPVEAIAPYIAGQMLGAMVGAVLVYIQYLPHWKETKDPATILGVFSTGPAIRNLPANFVSEVIGTFVLIYGLLALGITDFGSGLAPLAVGALIVSIGLSLGGTTGYAINPARDLGPRIVHAILPIPNKGGSDWSYSWVPVLGPIVGAVLAAVTFAALPL